LYSCTKAECRRNGTASIIGSATPDEAAYRAKRLNYPNNNAFDKSGVYSKLLEVADAVIKANGTI
jgi:hypothetical protein